MSIVKQLIFSVLMASFIVGSGLLIAFPFLGDSLTDFCMMGISFLYMVGMIIFAGWLGFTLEQRGWFRSRKERTQNALNQIRNL